jgi:uncharacterized small protein (DUF1192 family)
MVYYLGHAKATGERTMDTDDLEPTKRPVGKPDLEVMSIEQLKDYIAEMESEIARVREVINAKGDAHSAADAVFKT